MRLTGVQVRWVCETCDGNGRVATDLPYCRSCDRSYTYADLAFFNSDTGWDELLPCGHHQHDLRENRTCIDCTGRGWGQGWVPVEELRESLLRNELPR